MAVTIATVLVRSIEIYLALGLLMLLPFQVWGLARVDAAPGTRGFRILISPGIVALWPLLALRWARASGSPPSERNPHRAAAPPGAAAETPGDAAAKPDQGSPA